MATNEAGRVEFDAKIGVDVKGETWSCIEIPDSVRLFGTGRSVRVDATVDGVALENVGAMPTGTNGHMVSVNAKVRTALGKDVGDEVHVVIARRA